MKRVIFIISILFAMITTATAESIIIDTRIEGLNNSLSNRISRVAYLLTPEILIRGKHSVMGGIGLTGEINNYTIGAQVAYQIKLMENSLTLAPFTGINMSSSDVAAGSVSAGLGLDVKYKLFDWLMPVIGADAQFFSDSYLLDYYGGASFPLFSWFSVDILYSAILTSEKHRMGGGARINLYF